MAPFWRGLENFDERWTELQLVSAARGLPIPPADQIPPDLEAPPVADTQRPTTANFSNPTVPSHSRSDSFTSDAINADPNARRASASSSQQPHIQSSSPFRPRSKTIASLSGKNPSQSEMVPREIQLPVDPYVNGLRIEAFLYKDATECPICFIYNPPYLNQTRCCDQPICSECFVQIKRPDPHFPESHDDSGNPPSAPEENPETLVSEPANCPYCQQPEFGVTYDPPHFRKGLAYANVGSVNNGGTASPASSVNSGVSSPTLRPDGGRRRATSVSALDSRVVTTDKVRPDWATKLANARNHAARRSAAATALHTAAYLMDDGRGLEGRGFSFGSRGRFGRGRGSPAESGSGGPDVAARQQAYATLAAQHEQRQREQQQGGASRRRSRMDDLEDVMLMEAIRLSIAAEEDRKRKEDKEKAKEEKKKAKELAKDQKKADKVAGKGPYGEGSSRSRSGSALSLILPGRRRGNSTTSNLAREAPGSSGNNDKGKGVDRRPASSSNTTSFGGDGTSPSPSFGQHLTPAEASAPASSAAPDRPSHLRQMSTASSLSSSFLESTTNSVRNGFQASSSSIDSANGGVDIPRSAGHEDPGNAGDEPMFNFRSLQERVGGQEKDEGYEENQIEYSNDSRPRSRDDRGEASSSTQAFGSGLGDGSGHASSNHLNDMEEMDQSFATLRADDHHESSDAPAQAHTAPTPYLEVTAQTPGLMVTPGTPAPQEENKQLGH